MKIKIREKYTDDILTYHKVVTDSDSCCYCIHDDVEKRLLFFTPLVVGSHKTDFPQRVLFCPYTGFTYEEKENE